MFINNGKVSNLMGLSNYRSSHPKEYYGGFDHNDQLLGFANVDFEDDHFYISQLAVDPKHRNKGIGGQLLTYICDQAKAEGESRVSLSVQITNIPAIRFFLSSGFTIIDYHVETDYIPKNLDLEGLKLTKNEDHGEFLRLVEYQMIYHLKK